jgi:hypothetical protein
MSTLFTKLSKQTRKKKPAVVEKTDSLKETWSDFEEWYYNFIAKFGGYEPANLRNWFDIVQEKHIDLREQIGGIRTHTTYELPEYQGPADAKDCEKLISRIKEIMPRYLRDSKLTEEHLLSGSMPNGMRTSKHIIRYAGSKYDMSLEHRSELMKIISALGEKWANAKTTSQEITVTISTSAKGFASIGHYGPDNISCFKQSGSNASNKYALGRLKNTFVVLLRESITRVHEPIDSKSTFARLWGFFNPDENVVNFCNYYPVAGFMEGNAFEACKLEAATMLGCSVEDINCEKNKIYVPSAKNIYHNNKETQPNWSFFIGDKTIDTQVL